MQIGLGWGDGASQEDDGMTALVFRRGSVVGCSGIVESGASVSGPTADCAPQLASAGGRDVADSTTGCAGTNGTDCNTAAGLVLVLVEGVTRPGSTSLVCLLRFLRGGDNSQDWAGT